MKTTTAERDPEAAAKLHELIEGIAIAMVVTVTPDGALRSRPMLTVDTVEEGELWFFTSDDSRTAQDIADEHAVNVNYADPSRDAYVSVGGQASLVKDEKTLEKLWDPALSRYFPQGLGDPHLTLLRVRIESAEYWESGSSKMRPLQHARGGSKNTAAKSDPTGGKQPPEDHTKVDIRATQAMG